MNTYEQYVEIRKSYNFSRIDRVTWQGWQIHYYGYYISSKTGEAKMRPDPEDLPIINSPATT